MKEGVKNHMQLFPHLVKPFSNDTKMSLHSVSINVKFLKTKSLKLESGDPGEIMDEADILKKLQSLPGIKHHTQSNPGESHG